MNNQMNHSTYKQANKI